MSKRFFPRLSRVTAIWLTVFILGQYARLYFNGPFLGLYLGFLWLIGLLLILWLLLGLREMEQRLLTLTLLLFSVFVLHLFYFYGKRVAVLTFFFLHKSQYEAVVADVTTSLNCSSNNRTLTRWRVECEPRRQVAFLLPAAKSHSWQGIVYGLPENVVAGQKFGNSLVATEHLYGNWYLCTFAS